MIRLADTVSLAEPLSSCLESFSKDDAYAISREVLRRREASGWRRIGRKIGFTNREIWDQYGVYEPILGPMYDRTVSFVLDRTWDVDGWGDEASLSLEGLAQPLIEPEIVFHFRRPPPLTDDPVVLLDAIDWLGHGFEIVQCHFPGWKFAVEDTIADLGLHGRYVAGGGIAVPHDEAGRRELAQRLATFRIRLYRNGVLTREGGGDLVLGSPLKALAHAIRLLDSLPDHPPIEAGEIVTTGTLTDAMPVEAGETWSTRIDGLPLSGISLRFVTPASKAATSRNTGASWTPAPR
jgi:2-oxo-3-hexenedioate decarboxylase